MSEIIQEFIDYMSTNGLAPASHSEIKADNKRNGYRIAGDPKGKKKGFYKLKIDGDFGFGFFGDYRQGDDFISWHNQSKASKYTLEQKEASRKRREEEERVALAEKQALWTQRADEAENFIIFLDKATSTPYLARKGIKGYIALQSGADLIIPMGDSERAIWSYQLIKPDGTKLFCGGDNGSKAFGCWSAIEGSDTICIAEGYATACSIHEATGFTVIIAWSSGNMERIAPLIAGKYPGKEIIICADNDTHKINPKTNEPYQTGLKAGRKAALLINAKLSYPEFQNNDTKPTDFNDLHLLEGLEAVANRIRFAGEVPARSPSSPLDEQQPGGDDFNKDWESQLHRNKKGELDQRSSTNLRLYMKYHEDLRGVFKYDSFAKRIIVARCPPWEAVNGFHVRAVQDYDYFRLECYMESEFSIKAPKNKCADVIESTAQLNFNTFNPASDYFSALQWDGVPRIDTWLKKYVSDTTQSEEYLTLVGRKFLCGLAGRAIYPGIKFDTMIILEGKQYAGKSFLSKILATINGIEYFLDDFKEIDNKDALMKIQGKLVVEFPEISTMRKAEVNDLKAFLSRTHDVFRPPYGRNTMEAPRQCVFVGTINPEGPYLRDVTGNRRYWPVSCREDINLEELKTIVPLLHAEAAHLVRHGEQLWITKEEYALAVVEQDKRVINDIWIDSIQEIVEMANDITTDEILKRMEIPRERRTPQMQSRIVQTMVSLGWEYARLVRGTKRLRGFKRTGNDNHYQATLEDGAEEVKWF